MHHFYTRISFIIGIVIGVFLAVYIKKYSVIQDNNNKPNQKDALYKNWFNKHKVTKRRLAWDQLRYTNTTFYSEAQYLFNNIKLLCVILVKSPKNLIAAQDTWAKGCNSIRPITLETQNKIMPAKRVKEKSSWIMLCKLLNKINAQEFDWVLVVKDTSFVITENLRYYVAPLNARKSHYLGHAVKFWSTIYNSGEPGYALSKGTIKRFQKHMNDDKCLENSYWNREDFYLGKYLAQVNITPSNTHDDEGLSTFHPYHWYHVFYPSENYYQNSIFPVKCCSKRSIAFQAIEGDRMYTYNYLFYTLQIFTGGINGNQPLIHTVPEDKTWKQFLRDQNIKNDNISSEEYYKLWENLINDPTSFEQNLKREHLFDYD